jgi:hypothetical protein
VRSSGGERCGKLVSGQANSAWEWIAISARSFVCFVVKNLHRLSPQIVDGRAA